MAWDSPICARSRSTRSSGASTTRCSERSPARSIGWRRKAPPRCGRKASAPLAVDFGDAATIATNFAAAHEQRFGFLMPDKPLILEAVSAEIVGAGDAPEEQTEPPSSETLTPLATVALWSGGAMIEAPIYDRDRMRPGQTVTGPALIREATATTVVDAGWRAALDERRYLVMERVTPLPRRVAIGTSVDPVMLEVFNNLFMAIAEQMGTALQNTAYSVNIKER